MLGSVITLRSKDWGRKDSGLNGSVSPALAVVLLFALWGQ